MKKCTVKELMALAESLYVGTKEIQLIGYVGKNAAIKIKNEINAALKSEGAYVHRDVVPTIRIIRYFGLEEFIKK